MTRMAPALRTFYVAYLVAYAEVMTKVPSAPSAAGTFAAGKREHVDPSKQEIPQAASHTLRPQARLGCKRPQFMTDGAQAA